MAFTDRFIKLPIEVFDKNEKELTGKENLVESWIKILPMEIAEYRPSYSIDDTETDQTSITLKCGSSILTLMTVDKFEDLIDKFMAD